MLNVTRIVTWYIEVTCIVTWERLHVLLDGRGDGIAQWANPGITLTG